MEKISTRSARLEWCSGKLVILISLTLLSPFYFLSFSFLPLHPHLTTPLPPTPKASCRIYLKLLAFLQLSGHAGFSGLKAVLSPSLFSKSTPPSLPGELLTTL
jgi:hypothetical protein